jgi:hypothetical protein
MELQTCKGSGTPLCNDFLRMKAGHGIKVMNTIWAHYFSITYKVFIVSFTLFPMLFWFLLNICWKLASYGLKRQWILKKKNHVTTDNGKRFSLMLNTF